MLATWYTQETGHLIGGENWGPGWGEGHERWASVLLGSPASCNSDAACICPRNRPDQQVRPRLVRTSELPSFCSDSLRCVRLGYPRVYLVRGDEFLQREGQEELKRGCEKDKERGLLSLASSQDGGDPRLYLGSS